MYLVLSVQTTFPSFVVACFHPGGNGSSSSVIVSDDCFDLTVPIAFNSINDNKLSYDEENTILSQLYATPPLWDLSI